MYFELKVFESGEKMKIQLDSKIPFANDTSSIINSPGIEAKRLREILLFISNDLIPRIVASENKADNYVGPIIKEFKKNEAASLEKMIKLIEDKTTKLSKLTGFNFEELSPGILTKSIASIVNGDIPPPSRPKS